ncbi:thiamine-phosphate kinase [Nesterenkonia muleiensis]|uniref:thiamine-phosphate kinase n=1 Tax=Nesterenkonia muleiensis TaxID=2282648 RepID=UPI0013905AF2|nr:thiamine-phosphate kinase [Nesterenkonia muleiensis]
MSDDQLTVGAVGEDAVLAAMMEVVGPHSAGGRGEWVRTGAGEDDAAVLSPPRGVQTVMTVDTMSEGQDFRREWWLGPESLGATPYEPSEEWPMDVGTKAAAQNLSDINAMGAVPEALLVSLTLPPGTPLAWVQDFYRGIIRACQAPGAENCSIAGGDLGSGETISVTITAVGGLPEGSPGLLRSRARAGDTLAVCGGLGDAAAGLALLERPGDETVSGQELGLWEAHSETFRRCLLAQTHPQPPLTAGPAALAAGATAGMDLSDGLLRDAQRLAAASGVRIQLDDAALAAEAVHLEPVAELLGLAASSCRDWVLTGGEDYSLLATFPEDAALPDGFRSIGRVEVGDPQVRTGLRGVGEGWDSLLS